MSILYFDAFAGAGKTRALARHADRLARRGAKVLFVQPSKLLIDNTFKDEVLPLQPAYPVKRLHSGVVTNVTGALVSHFKAAKTGGEILFATHSAFLKLPYVENADRWTVIMDESPTVDVFNEHNIPATHRIVTDLFDFAPEGPVYGRLSPAAGKCSALEKIARNPDQDEVYAQFADLAHRVVSDHWDVYAHQSGFGRLTSGDREHGRLTTFSLLKPSIFEGFRQTVIASACFEDTMLYRLWTAQGVRLKPVKDSLRKDLRYERHANGSLMSIFYFSDEDWSKSLRDRPIDYHGEKVPVVDRVVSTIEQMFSGESFAWMANKDLANVFAHMPGAEWLPNSPHGLNTFQHLHNVFVMSALNPPPTHFSFMDCQGVNSDEVKTAHYRSAVYQAVMRISIRNPQDTHGKMVVVMDRATAHWLADLFPGARVEPLEETGIHLVKGKPGRPRRHRSNAEKTHQCRAAKKQQFLAELDQINGTCLVHQEYDQSWAEAAHAAEITSACNENTYKEGQIVTRLTSGTAFSSLYDTTPHGYLDLDSDDEFIRLLALLHERRTGGKEDNFLLSPAHFDPDMSGAETRRGLANIQHVRGIWLDNDGGDLTHEEFARIFPYLRIVVWNTYSSTPEKPRWRAFIPTSLAMTVEVHRVIMEQIRKVLQDAGYRSKEDIGKGRPSKNGCHGC